MLIKMNTEHLRMTVLKQIVDNATKAMVIDRKRTLLDWIFPFTSKNIQLKKMRKRGDKLEQFEVALSKNEDEFSYIEFHDVDFIYKGLHW